MCRLTKVGLHIFVFTVLFFFGSKNIFGQNNFSVIGKWSCVSGYGIDVFGDSLTFPSGKWVRAPSTCDFFADGSYKEEWPTDNKTITGNFHWHKEKKLITFDHMGETTLFLLPGVAEPVSRYQSWREDCEILKLNKDTMILRETYPPMDEQLMDHIVYCYQRNDGQSLVVSDGIKYLPNTFSWGCQLTGDLFVKGKDSLLPSTFIYLDSVADFLLKNPNVYLEVTCSPDLKNIDSHSQLGSAREKMICDYLVNQKHIAKEQIVPLAYSKMVFNYQVKGEIDFDPKEFLDRIQFVVMKQ